MFQTFLRSILIFLLVLSCWVLYVNFQQSKQLERFSNDYIWQLNTSIKDATRNFILPAKNIAKLGAYMYQENLISFAQPESLKTFVAPFVESYPQFKGYFVGLETKEFWFWRNTYDPNYAFRIQEIRVNNNDREDRKEYLDKERQHLRFSELMTANYDPSSRIWYEGAKAVGTSFWSDVYSFNTPLDESLPGITASYPIYDENNALIGVWGVDIVLAELSNFLFDVGSSRATEMAIFSETNKVIAYSGLKDINIKGKLLTASDLDKAPIQKALQSYKNHGFSEFYFTENGIRYLASYSSFLFGSEHKWNLLLVVPESQLIEKMGKNYSLILFFAFTIILVSLICLIYLIRQPLRFSLSKMVDK